MLMMTPPDTQAVAKQPSSSRRLRLPRRGLITTHSTTGFQDSARRVARVSIRRALFRLPIALGATSLATTAAAQQLPLGPQVTTSRNQDRDFSTNDVSP